MHWLKWMGPQVAVLGIDMRSQREKARIMPQVGGSGGEWGGGCREEEGPLLTIY